MYNLAGTLLENALSDVAMEQPELLAPVVARAVQRPAIVALAHRPTIMLSELAHVGPCVEPALQLVDD